MSNTTCDPDVAVSEFSSEPSATPQVGSCLVLEPDQTHTHTANRSTDARTALKRGLANYMKSLPTFIHPTHGRLVKLAAVFDVWPDQEDKLVIPSATVYSSDPHPYEAHALGLTIDCKIDAVTYLVKYAEIKFDMTIDILTSDPEERIAFSMMMEDALNPVDWMYGFKLDLPHYHNQRAVYELIGGNYPDDEPNVFQRNRHLTYTVRGNVSAVRVKTITPITSVTVTSTVEDTTC